MMEKLPFNARNIEIFQWFIIGLTGYFLLRSGILKILKSSEYNKAGTDANTSLAIAIRQAVNPWGVDWAIEFDGTSEGELMDVAKQITDFESVAASYSRLYAENLVDRLQKELSVQGFQQFIAAAKAPKNSTTVPGTTPGTNPTSGKIESLFAVGTATVFKFEDSAQIAKTVPVGQLIGQKIGAYYITSQGVRRLYYLVRWTTLLGYKEYKGFVLATQTRQQ